MHCLSSQGGASLCHLCHLVLISYEVYTTRLWVPFLLLCKLVCYAKCISKYSSRHYSNGWIWIEGREHTCGRVQRESMEVVITALNEGDWGHILYACELWWDFTMRLSPSKTSDSQPGFTVRGWWSMSGEEERERGYSEWVDSFSQSSHCKAPLVTKGLVGGAWKHHLPIN